MALSTLRTTEGLPAPIGTEIAAAIRELQGLRFTLVAGAAAATNIAVAGIAVADTLVSVLRFDVDTTLRDITDVTSEAAIRSAGNIQLTTTVTTGDKLLVIWIDKA